MQENKIHYHQVDDAESSDEKSVKPLEIVEHDQHRSCRHCLSHIGLSLCPVDPQVVLPAIQSLATRDRTSSTPPQRRRISDHAP